MTTIAMRDRATKGQDGSGRLFVGAAVQRAVAY